MDGADHLALVVTVSYKGAVGFGDVFECEIRSVLSGSLKDPKILLTILANDKDKLSFISARLHPAEIEIGFTINRKGEPYSFAPISGFVDSSRTSWRLEYVREPMIELP
jgi:hypothetical protein